MGNFPIGKKSEVIYEEGIYVGYRYYNTFKVKPAYVFGFGLSYTNFSYGKIVLSSPTFNGILKATIKITNTGKIAGKEVVQLYLTAPAKNIDKPVDELKGFAKTNLLQPGQSQTVTFMLNAKLLASYITQKSSWIAEAGDYTININASSTNFIQTIHFKLLNELMVEKCYKVLSPSVEINELKK